MSSLGFLDCQGKEQQPMIEILGEEAEKNDKQQSLASALQGRVEGTTIHCSKKTLRVEI